MMSSHFKVLSKTSHAKLDSKSEAGDGSQNTDANLSNIEQALATTTIQDIGLHKLKHESEAISFKLIDERDWNIANSEPCSETTFFADGHSAMSIISVIGPKGVGKSSLLNRIAKKQAFATYKSSSESGSARITVQHVTKGIDIHSTHHRMLLDCQPLLASSVLEDFLSGHSSSQFPKNSLISDPLISCHMISLQLATFLIATSDYVIIMSKWLIDVHLLKLISSAIMMIGENNLRAKFVVFSNDKKIYSDKFRSIINATLGKIRIDKYFDNEKELLEYISAYSSEKCELYEKDPTTFTGKNWLSSCQRLWNTTIKNSSMFSDYAHCIAAVND